MRVPSQILVYETIKMAPGWGLAAQWPEPKRLPFTVCGRNRNGRRRITAQRVEMVNSQRTMHNAQFIIDVIHHIPTAFRTSRGVRSQMAVTTHLNDLDCTDAHTFLSTGGRLISSQLLPRRSPISPDPAPSSFPLKYSGHYTRVQFNFILVYVSKKTFADADDTQRELQALSCLV